MIPNVRLGNQNYRGPYASKNATIIRIITSLGLRSGPFNPTDMCHHISDSKIRDKLNDFINGNIDIAEFWGSCGVVINPGWVELMLNPCNYSAECVLMTAKRIFLITAKLCGLPTQAIAFSLGRQLSESIFNLRPGYRSTNRALQNGIDYRNFFATLPILSAESTQAEYYYPRYAQNRVIATNDVRASESTTDVLGAGAGRYGYRNPWPNPLCSFVIKTPMGHFFTNSPSHYCFLFALCAVLAKFLGYPYFCDSLTEQVADFLWSCLSGMDYGTGVCFMFFLLSLCSIFYDILVIEHVIRPFLW